MGYTLTKAETETVIGFDDSGGMATVYTCNAALKRRLQGLGADVRAQDEVSITFVVPKKWVKIHPPRVMSDEQKALATERLRGIK